MNKLNLVMACCAGMLALGAQAATNVSISIGQPGFFGHIDIGDAPAPAVIYEKPVIVQKVKVQPEPIYLRVPPGHERNWAKHCRQYNACGRPVYFVRDDWYRNVYAPHYREHHPDMHDERRGPPHERDDHRGPDHDRHGPDDHGPGRDHGHHGR